MNDCCNHKNKPRVSIIAAIGRNRELGASNDMLWHIREDFKNLVKITKDKPIIMGSKTYESIGRPLPKRLNIVLSHQSDYNAPGCTMVTSLEDAMVRAREEGTEEIIIFGGGFVYRQALEMGVVERMYLTLVDADFPQADVFFPEYKEVYGFTKVIAERDGKKEISQKDKTFSYKFVTLERDDKNENNTD